MAKGGRNTSEDVDLSLLAWLLEKPAAAPASPPRTAATQDDESFTTWLFGKPRSRPKKPRLRTAPPPAPVAPPHPPADDWVGDARGSARSSAPAAPPPPPERPAAPPPPPASPFYRPPREPPNESPPEEPPPPLWPEPRDLRPGRPRTTLRNEVTRYAIAKILAHRDVELIAHDLQVNVNTLVRWVVQMLTHQSSVLTLLERADVRGGVALVLPSGNRIENVTLGDVMALEQSILFGGKTNDSLVSATLRRKLRRLRGQVPDEVPGEDGRTVVVEIRPPGGAAPQPARKRGRP